MFFFFWEGKRKKSSVNCTVDSCGAVGRELNTLRPSVARFVYTELHPRIAISEPFLGEYPTRKKRNKKKTRVGWNRPFWPWITNQLLAHTQPTYTSWFVTSTQNIFFFLHGWVEFIICGFIIKSMTPDPLYTHNIVLAVFFKSTV